MFVSFGFFFTAAREGAEQETSSLMGEFVAQQQVRHSKSPGHFPDDPDRWNSIVVAKDELIRQKDEIIDRYCICELGPPACLGVGLSHTEQV